MHSLSKLKHVPWSATTGCPASATATATATATASTPPQLQLQVCLIHLHLLITTATRWRFFTFADLTSPSTDRHLDRSIDRSSPIVRQPPSRQGLHHDTAKHNCRTAAAAATIRWPHPLVQRQDRLQRPVNNGPARTTSVSARCAESRFRLSRSRGADAILKVGTKSATSGPPPTQASGASNQFRYLHTYTLQPEGISLLLPVNIELMLLMQCDKLHN